MALQTDLDTALYTKLTTVGGTALWGARVYAQQAPQGATLPYVVYFHVAGGDTNESPSRIVDMTYQIEAWAETQAQARQGADYLESALHNGSVTVTGWNVIAITQLDIIADVENEHGQQYWRRGAEYRVRMST